MENNQQSTQQDRIPVEINRKLYHRVKFADTRKHMTISTFLEELLDEMVPEINDVVTPGHPITRESLEKLQEIREELFKRNNYQNIGNSVEEIRQMREERLQELMANHDKDL